MTHIPLCTDCTHFVGCYSECYRVRSFNPVTGETVHRRDAHNERAPRFLGFGKNRCGPEGQFFVSAIRLGAPPTGR